jgi:hypothetical protein
MRSVEQALLNYSQTNIEKAPVKKESVKASKPELVPEAESENKPKPLAVVSNNIQMPKTPPIETAEKSDCIKSNSPIINEIILEKKQTANQDPVKPQPLSEVKQQNLFSDKADKKTLGLSLKTIGKLYNTYLVVKTDNTAYIIDQHAAHERVLYDGYISGISTKNVVPQMLLVPYVFNVNHSEAQFLSDNKAVLSELGFELSEFGHLSFKVSTIPSFLLNMDIIAGLPGDTPKGFNKTLDEVIALNPENITIHTLSQKKGSKLFLENIPLPTTEEVEKMLDYASLTLTAGSYKPYYLYRQKYMLGGFENIGWSIPGYDGLYNKFMMEDLGTVIGFGAGSVTKLVLEHDRIERIFNMKYPKEYILQSNKIIDKIYTIKQLIAGDATPGVPL